MTARPLPFFDLAVQRREAARCRGGDSPWATRCGRLQLASPRQAMLRAGCPLPSTPLPERAQRRHLSVRPCPGDRGGKERDEEVRSRHRNPTPLQAPLVALDAWCKRVFCSET